MFTARITHRVNRTLFLFFSYTSKVRLLYRLTMILRWIHRENIRCMLVPFVSCCCRVDLLFYKIHIDIMEQGCHVMARILNVLGGNIRTTSTLTDSCQVSAQLLLAFTVSSLWYTTIDILYIADRLSVSLSLSLMNFQRESSGTEQGQDLGLGSWSYDN